MKFSIGDRVLMKRTGEEGIITAFLSADLVEVEIAEIRFPVYENELEHPYLSWFTAPKKRQPLRRVLPAEPAYARPARLSRGIYLSFFPRFAQNEGEEIIESFRIHLLNETAEHLAFTYDPKTAQGLTLLHLSGAQHPFSDIFLHTLSLEEMNAQPRFIWSIAPKEKPDAGKNITLRIRPAQLLRYMKSLLEEGTPSFSILLAEDAEVVPPASLPLLPDMGKARRGHSKIHMTSDPEAVLDLHMDADEKEAAQVLDAQLRLLDQKLHAAFASGQEKMIVIHGIGAGVLREAVHRLLRETAFVASFRNEWTAGYGHGATEVFFAAK